MRKKTPKPRRTTWTTADWVACVENGNVRHYPVDSERGRQIVAELGGAVIAARHRSRGSDARVEPSERVSEVVAVGGWAQLELFPEDTP